MDREQEDMQFLGLFGIYRESFKIIITWRKIFTQITLALILPLSFIFLAHKQISNRISWKIEFTEYRLHKNETFEWLLYYLFEATYFTFLLIFSLLSTSAVVYTIASIYTGREVSFNKVMSVVPKVWKRLMITFLIIFLVIFAYNIVAITLITLCLLLFSEDGIALVIIFHIFLITYIVVFVYLSVLWQLASVVTVLEDSYGFKAMVKSKKLIKGKIWVALAIFFKLNFLLVLIQFLFELHVLYHHSLPMWKKVAFGMLCLLLLLIVILLGLVIQTVYYLVCKSYHHESIDKSSLSNHLEGYLGDYEPLKNEMDVQLQEYDV